MDATANKLVEATCDGKKPVRIRIGDIMIPPPSPSIEPTIPAATPMTNVKNRFSSKLYVNRSISF